ncbi:DUF6508 domain-containing protein [Amedibacillus sp. YH-ame6]
MGKYNELTKYINYIDDDNFGEWVIDDKNEGTIDNPIQMPFVSYFKMIIDFEKDIYKFVETYPNLNLKRYCDILESYGIEWSSESMKEADLSNIDERCVLALLLGIIRADRMCEGTLLSFFKNGSIRKWLSYLREIDENQS